MLLNETTPEFIAALAKVTEVYSPETKYLEEPRGRCRGKSASLVRPRDTSEVSAIITLCNEFKVGVVPYGGGTGLVGGQISSNSSQTVILSLERMNKICKVDTLDNTLTVEAGAILADIQSAAENVGRLFPLSLASEGSCQIGGNLSTNAGGVNVVRYGNTRDLCIGIEAVLPDGTIINELKRLRKDNTGYNLRNLIIGAEGTLGIITAATLRMMPAPAHFETAFLAIDDPEVGLEVFNRLAPDVGPLISAFELVNRKGFEFLMETGMEFTEPLSSKPEWMILLECGAGSKSRLKERLENVLSEMFEDETIKDAVLAQNESQRQAFWAIRENIPEANRRIGVISSHDISVPVSLVPEFIAAAAQQMNLLDPTLRVNCFGHLGDGNMHYNVYPPKGVDRAEFDDVRGDIKDIIYDLVNEFGGSFSAEHGIGRMKKSDLLKYADAGKLTAMRAIKDALDPNGIMNPGAVI